MKKVNSLQLKDQKAQLKKRAQEIIDTVKKEMRDLTNEESQEIEDMKQQMKEKEMLTNGNDYDAKDFSCACRSCICGSLTINRS